METAQRFDKYLEHLSGGLGHADRVSGLRGYCTGLMQPLARKNIEPMAAHLEQLRVSAKHQALHHFVARAEWSDEEMLRRVAQWVLPKMDFSGGGWWIVDDTGFPKKGKHSVGVARQYCGQLGKQDNCQVTLASEAGNLPVAWRLYLPQTWAEDAARQKKIGVPEAVQFETKTQIVLGQICTLLAEGTSPYPVLTDASYGVDTAFRQALTELGVQYVLGITSAITVWLPGIEPLPPWAYTGKGRPPVQPRRTADRQPLNVKALAMQLPSEAYQTIRWREGTTTALSGRFAAVRVRHAEDKAGSRSNGCWYSGLWTNPSR